MPPLLRLILGVLLVLAGLALLAVAVLGARSRLPRNRWAGVRTPATLRSDAAFAVAHRVAAAPLAAAAAVSVACGAVLLAGATGLLGWVLLAVSVVGMFVLVGTAGVAGDRAAAAVAPEIPESAACGGACAGCDLIEGCRPAAGPGPAEKTRAE